MPEDGLSNDSVFAVFKLWIVLLVYHREFLDTKLHVDNAMQCLSFRSETITYSHHATTLFPWNCTVDTPELSGLPVDEMYMTKIKHL